MRGGGPRGLGEWLLLPPERWKGRRLSAVRWGWRCWGLRGRWRRGAGTGGGVGDGGWRAEARLLATMALVRESRGRVDGEGAFVCLGTGEARCEGEERGGAKVGGGWRDSCLPGCRFGVVARDRTRGDCVDEAETKLSSEDTESSDVLRFPDGCLPPNTNGVFPSDRVPSALADRVGGSSLGVSIILLGFGDTTSASTPLTTGGGGGVAGLSTSPPAATTTLGFLPTTGGGPFFPCPSNPPLPCPPLVGDDDDIYTSPLSILGLPPSLLTGSPPSPSPTRGLRPSKTSTKPPSLPAAAPLLEGVTLACHCGVPVPGLGLGLETGLPDRLAASVAAIYDADALPAPPPPPGVCSCWSEPPVTFRLILPTTPGLVTPGLLLLPPVAWVAARRAPLPAEALFGEGAGAGFRGGGFGDWFRDPLPKARVAPVRAAERAGGLDGGTPGRVVGGLLDGGIGVVGLGRSPRGILDGDGRDVARCCCPGAMDGWVVMASWWWWCACGTRGCGRGGGRTGWMWVCERGGGCREGGSWVGR